MDILLQNKDICLDIYGRPVMISQTDEAVQQVLLTLQIPRGSFIYDKELGSLAGQVDISSDNDLLNLKKMEMVMNEAIAGMANTRVQVDAIAKNSEGKTAVMVTINHNNELRYGEVVI